AARSARRAGDGCSRSRATAVQPRAQLNRGAHAGATQRDARAYRTSDGAVRLSGSECGVEISDGATSVKRRTFTPMDTMDTKAILPWGSLCPWFPSWWPGREEMVRLPFLRPLPRYARHPRRAAPHQLGADVFERNLWRQPRLELDRDVVRLFDL